MGDCVWVRLPEAAPYLRYVTSQLGRLSFLPLRGTVKLVSALGLGNNKWRWWMRMVHVAAIYGGLTVQVGWLDLRAGGEPALSLHSSNEPGELSQWPCHDHSTINIISVIILLLLLLLYMCA